MATSANTMPNSSLRVKDSFKRVNDNNIVTKGYRAVMVTTTEALPLLIALRKNIAPLAPAIPVKTLKIIPFKLVAILNPPCNKMIKPIMQEPKIL